jgi:hypothetical protein
VKSKFFKEETQFNTELELEELKKLAAEKLKREQEELERIRLEEEEKKREQEELERQEMVYGPGGRFGKRPELAAITKVLE